jgi:aryl sulfotransferase
MDGSIVRYRNIVMDNARWDGFDFRDGDIVISTPAKCGTTWTQTICALLIFGRADLPKPVDLLSPWLDQTLRPLDDVKADLDAQAHRRFIKTHTPLDGLPWDDRVTYITVARDPRDVAMSWDNHMSNLNIPAMIDLRGKAVGNDDLPELMATLPMPLPDEASRFWAWVETTDDPMGGLAGTVHHLKTFWDARERPNVILLHYSDLKADLDGQMRALAQRLGLTVDVTPELVKAATFDEMRKHATEVGPNQSENIWLDRERFFNKGTNGQWHDVLTDEKRYWDRVGQLTDEGFSAWLHR